MISQFIETIVNNITCMSYYMYDSRFKEHVCTQIHNNNPPIIAGTQIHNVNNPPNIAGTQSESYSNIYPIILSQVYPSNVLNVFPP